MPTHSLSERRKRRKKDLTQAKAKKISSEGLKSAGDGFHSERQERLINFVADGGTPTRLRKRPRRRRSRRRLVKKA